LEPEIILAYFIFAISFGRTAEFNVRHLHSNFAFFLQLVK